MRPQAVNHTGVINEILKGIVDRVTYHNPDNGWSILRVMPFNNPQGQETVIVHQTKVFAGATMEFQGSWIVHPKQKLKYSGHFLKARPGSRPRESAKPPYLGQRQATAVSKPRPPSKSIRSHRASTSHTHSRRRKSGGGVGFYGAVKKEGMRGLRA